MTAVDEQGAACADLPYQVVDKYFEAHAFEQRFEHLTAKAICGHCAVQAACLAEAIQEPRSYVTRGGESPGALRHLRREYLAGVPVEDVVTAALARQKPHGGINARTMRAGKFNDVGLVGPAA